jgi:ATP-binding cassette subfamily B multidrug efflux pump
MTPAASRVEAIVTRELADVEAYQGKTREDLGRLWSVYLKPYWGYLLVTVLLHSVNSSANYVFPLTARFLIDRVFGLNPAAQPIPKDERYFWLGVVVAVNLLVWIVTLVTLWLGQRMIVRIGQRLTFRLREDLHRKLQRLHIGFFDKNPPGRVLSRVLDDVGVIQQWSTDQLMNVVRSIVVVLIGAGMMIWLDWRLSLFVVLALPFYARAYANLRPRIRRSHIASRHLNSSLYALTTERIRGIRVVRPLRGKRRS